MNSDGPDVFVLVPSYNHAPYIVECLNSIINQTLAPKKLLVIDDGSSDGSPAMIESVLKECPFDSELIARENRGLCATLNQGFSLCGTKYFSYIGSDDLWLPEFLSRRVRLLESRPDTVLGYGHAYFVDEESDVLDSTAAHRDAWGDYLDGDVRAMLLRGIAPVSSTVMYRSSALKNVTWNEESRLEDYEMYLKLAELGGFAFDPDVLSAWRQHGYNTSKDKLLLLNEVIEAQRRNIRSLGVSEDELAGYQVRTKFRYARELLQFGDKRNAITLARSSWRGASSPVELGKFIVRLGVPMLIVNLKRRLRKYRYSRSH
jgi:alpha-1,3-rhamnosyltransferase